MIGPAVPDHLLSKRSTTPDDEEAGPSVSIIGPAIPQNLAPKPFRGQAQEEEEEEEDDYAPALPPELAAARSSQATTLAPPKSKAVAGPSLPPSLTHSRREVEEDEESDDDYGPQPLPEGVILDENEGVREFLEKEERRRKQIEEAAKPKALKREEWMLVPPSSSDLLGSIDTTKLNKPRQFARSAAPARDVDSTLWTETPAERQQRLADEVAGKRRRAVNADPDAGDEDKEAEIKKRRKRDEEIRRGVEEHTRKNRGGTLLEQHTETTVKVDRKGEDEGQSEIWEHGRDMALSGRLMDDKTRNKFINDARGLQDRFGTGKSGGFL